MKRPASAVLALLLCLPISTALAGVVGPPVSVVPEPATVALLAGGLAIMGGVALRRRNRK